MPSALSGLSAQASRASSKVIQNDGEVQPEDVPEVLTGSLPLRSIQCLDSLSLFGAFILDHSCAEYSPRFRYL